MSHEFTYIHPNVSTDGTMAANSSSLAPSQKAALTFINASGSSLTTIARAVQADMEADTSITQTVTSLMQYYTPSTVKSWAYITFSGGTPSITNSGAFSTVIDNGTGLTQCNWAIAFSGSSTYSVEVSAELTATTYAVALDRRCSVSLGSQNTFQCEITTLDQTAGTNLLKDPASLHIKAMGDV